MDLGDRFVFQYDKLPSVCFGIFKEMRQQGKLCDITIRLGKHEIFAHRLVLAAAIPYFRDMFGDRESRSDLTEITVREIDLPVLESLIDFAYSCKVEITDYNVKQLLRASAALKLDDVSKACCDFLSKRLNPRNVLAARTLAEKSSCTNLVDRIDSYICENFDEVAQTEEFLKAPGSFVMDLLARNDLKTLSEENVFQTVMRWVRKSPNERKNILPGLLSNIRFALLTPEYIMDCVMTEEYIRTSLPCRDLLDKVKFYHLLPHRRPEFTNIETRPRPCPRYTASQSVNAISGIYTLRKKVSISVQHFDPDKEEWTVVGATPLLEEYGTLTGTTDKLYFIDGHFLRWCTLPNCEWALKKNPFVGRICTGTAILNDKLYICGGREKFSLKKVECLDLMSNVCTVEAPMSVPRNLLGVVSLRGYLYALGGKNGEFVHESLERYDPVAKQWNLLSPMHIKRYGMGFCTTRGKIYVCGGKNSVKENKCLSSAEVYHPLIDEWNCISSMKTPRYRCSLVAYCGKLYALGGCDDQGEYLNSVEIYDPGNDEWKFGPPMGSFHTNMKAVAVPYSRRD